MSKATELAKAVVDAMDTYDEAKKDYELAAASNWGASNHDSGRVNRARNELAEALAALTSGDTL